jgi:glycosyltransferase involved in cell wall biosynthesis
MIDGNPDMDRCLTVVMPAYNEEGTISAIVEKVLEQSVVLELIVINDSSTDRTGTVLEGLAKKDPRIRLFHHQVNQGKGAALRTGFREARGPIVIVQDADMEYDPEEYHKMLKPILTGRADVVFGSRFLGSEAHRVLFYWHSVGNQVLTQLSNMLSNLNLTDMETCYKAFKREIIQAIEIEENRFGFEPEITAKLAHFAPRLRIYEVAVSYYGRTYEEGKKIGWRDGVRAFVSILKYNLFQRKTT